MAGSPVYGRDKRLAAKTGSGFNKLAIMVLVNKETGFSASESYIITIILVLVYTPIIVLQVVMSTLRYGHCSVE